MAGEDQNDAGMLATDNPELVSLTGRWRSGLILKVGGRCSRVECSCSSRRLRPGSLVKWFRFTAEDAVQRMENTLVDQPDRTF